MKTYAVFPSRNSASNNANTFDTPESTSLRFSSNKLLKIEQFDEKFNWKSDVANEIVGLKLTRCWVYEHAQLCEMNCSKSINIESINFRFNFVYLYRVQVNARKICVSLWPQLLVLRDAENRRLYRRPTYPIVWCSFCPKSPHFLACTRWEWCGDSMAWRISKWCPGCPMHMLPAKRKIEKNKIQSIFKIFIKRIAFFSSKLHHCDWRPNRNRWDCVATLWVQRLDLRRSRQSMRHGRAVIPLVHAYAKCHECRCSILCHARTVYVLDCHGKMTQRAAHRQRTAQAYFTTEMIGD